ncbi:MAG: GTP cyclohydrolase I FolE2 [Nitrososphaeria archaeon]
MSEEWKEITKRSNDVQYEKPKVRLKIRSVGISEFSIPLTKFSKEKIIYSSAEIKATVDIPEYMRGINMSRTATSIEKVLSSASNVEEVASLIASELLMVHEYAELSKARVKGEGFVYAESPVTGIESIESFKFYELSKDARKNTQKNIIGVTVTGISACPCGAELMKTKLGHSSGIAPTHMQRARVSVAVKSEGKNFLKIEELLDVAYASLSSRVYSALKRADEGFLIYSSITNTRFVEDIYRAAVTGLYTRFKNFSAVSSIYANIRSFESIHEYNAIASGWIDIKSFEKLNVY